MLRFRLLSALVMLVVGTSAFGGSPVLAASGTRCPKTTTYTLRTTDAQSATPTWKTTYSAGATNELYFADDLVGGTFTGTHTHKLEIVLPGGSDYQVIDQTFTATSGDALTCGLRLWTSIPVAGTIIQDYAVYGNWTANAYVDGVLKSSTAFTLTQ